MESQQILQFLYCKYIFLSLSVLYNIPTFLEIKTTIDQANNSTFTITGTSLRQNFLYFSIYKVYCKIGMDVISYVMIIVLNSFIVVKIIKSSRFRQTIATNEGTPNTQNTEIDRFQETSATVIRKSSNNSERPIRKYFCGEAAISNTTNKVRREMGMFLFNCLLMFIEYKIC